MRRPGPLDVVHRISAGQRLGQAEVGDSHVTLISHKYTAVVEVAVHQPLAVRVVQGARQLVHEAGRLSR